MAGMFYSLEEAVEKLNATEEQVKELVRAGKLREFRDGSNVLFKVDEVEALMSDTGVTAPEETPAAVEEQTDEDEISLISEAAAPETAMPDTAVPETTTPEVSVPEPAAPEIPVPEAEAPETAVPETPVPETPVPEATAPETTEDTAAGDELMDGDTVVAEQGINVLGETGGQKQETDDTTAETKGTTAEASLEEIEEDVNLDTFGSGSGLLDLSLQADDTSLGGILDEIYTSEGEEGEETREGSALEAAVDTEQMLTEEELAGPQPAPEVPAVVQGYIEPEPDTISNAFGIVLFLPLLVIVYTAIVAVAGFNDVMPVVREKIQGLIWYIMIGLAVAAGLIIGAAFMLTSGAGEAGRKKKARKPKRPKKKPRPTPES
jgi:excisionase family DNA binding protein